jgi:hypothetical protein
MKSWQIFDEARKVLKKEIYKIYGNRSSRLVDYWAQDPKFSADPKRNPIDRLEGLIKSMKENGAREAAISIVRILAAGVDCDVVPRSKVVPDKDTLIEEILDDLPFVLRYHEALQGTDLEAVDKARHKLIVELDENRVRFIEQLEKKDA